ncbi:MAG TPA: DUF4350 domain-containing protein, partial [Candidatus Methylacidiphilales bacterium]|nr:DUF4350 domain-containing protein [Candidatus Methylacidiphilales bacterium]
LPSSYNPVGAGSMAFFETLRDLHWPVERWRDPLSRLDQFGTGNVLVITRSKTGAPPVTFSDQENDLLLDWTKHGNTLVLLGAMADWDDTRDLLRAIGFGVPEKSPSVDELWQVLRVQSDQAIEVPPVSGMSISGTLVLPRTEPLPSTPPANTRTLFELAGEAYLVSVPYGNGRVLCCTSDRLLSNAWLEKGDNLAIVLSLLAPQGRPPHHLFFEESHHGFSAVYAMVRLLDQPGVRFAGMLALLGALAFFASSLVRFGPVIPLQPPQGRSTLEFVDSIADLYLRADLRNDTMHYLFAETHQQVLHRLNLPPTAPHELIASRLEQAHPLLPKWKKLAQRFDSNDYVQGLPPGGWLRVAKDLIEIKTAMA